MSNFYLGFRWNVFSKMFMMFAIFMAMSSSLWGVAPTFTAKTIDSKGTGTIDYIEITIDSGINTGNEANVQNYNISAVSDIEFKARFRLSVGQDPTTYAYLPVPGIDAIVGDLSDVTLLTSNAASKMSGAAIYLKLGGENSLDTGAKPQIIYTPRSSDTGAAIYNSSNTIMGSLNIQSSDGAKPILESVIAESVSGGDDTVTLTFSEKVKYKTDIDDTIGNIVIKDARDSGDVIMTLSATAMPADLTSGSDNIILSITDGLLETNYISGSKVKVDIEANSFKDLEDNILAVIDTESADLTTEKTSPKAKPSGTILDLNVNPRIVLKVDEKLKTHTGITLRVKTDIGVVDLDTSPTYTADKTLTLDLANSEADIISLRKILADKNNGDSDIKILITNGGTGKDVLGNPLSVDSVGVSPVYTKDGSAPLIDNIIYEYKNKVYINFTDGINKSLSQISSYLDIKYSGDTSLTSVLTKITDRKYLATFSGTTALSSGKTITVKTDDDYNSEMVNYTGLALIPTVNSYIKTITIATAPGAPAYSGFTLDMKTGIIVISFTNTVDATMSIGAFNWSNIAISSTNSGSSPMVLSSDEVTIDGVVSKNIASITDTGDTLTITLGAKDLEKLKVFLKDEDTAAKIKLNMSAINTLKNNYDAVVDAANDIALTTFSRDNTVPVISSWSLDLDAQSMAIVFDRPIAYTDNLNNTFSITKSLETKGTGNDHFFGNFSVVGVGTNSVDATSIATTVAFNTEDANDNHKTLIFDLNNSFVNEILNDSSLAIDKDNTFLAIRNNKITNISGVGAIDNTVPPKKINANAFTATKGNVNILFTRNKGVMMLDSQAVNKSDELNASKWFIKTIPSGVTLHQKQLVSSFSRTWAKNTNGTWVNANFNLSSSNGYWLKSDGQHRALIRATLDDSVTQESATEFEARIKLLTDNTYTLVGITNDITRATIREYAKRDSCVVYSHTYTPSESESGVGVWDKPNLILKAGDALWVKQNCNSSGTPPISQLD